MSKITDFLEIIDEMKNLYLHDDRPWIIGFSGGKDSTCVVQMTYEMLLELEPKQRKKKVHVVSSNTLVESPLIDRRISRTLESIDRAAKKDNLPIVVKRVKPNLDDTFWVNLIGRGYPSPNRWFRWCTDRLKIKPITRYILDQVKKNGEVIILLGARKSESGTRAQTMGKYEIKDFKLRKHATIPGAYVYTPIENLSFREVWIYLLSTRESPWGDKHNDLRFLYKRITQECPLVVDESTPPCGGSRFGCWVCTVVDEDKSLTGLIEDGEVWLKPLLEYRNKLKKIRDDPSYRDEVRKADKKKKARAERRGKKFDAPEHRGHKVLGPFKFSVRHELLRELIQLQQEMKEYGITLITPEEIKAIETIWIYEGDNISSIADVIGMPEYGDIPKDLRTNGFSMIKAELLQEVCKKNKVPPELIERLLLVEKDLSNLSRRTGIYNRLEKVLDEYIIDGAKT